MHTIVEPEYSKSHMVEQWNDTGRETPGKHRNGPMRHMLILAFELKSGTGFQPALHATSAAWYHCHSLETLVRARRIQELDNATKINNTCLFRTGGEKKGSMLVNPIGVSV